MQRLQDNLPIVLAAVLSLLLHAFVLFPALGLIGAGSRYLDGTKTGLMPEAPAARGEEEIPEKEHGRTERRAENARRALQERRERERERLEEERERDVRLGIDESDAATMNWIGYDEYREHLAELAEVEQAAFRLEAASGSQGTASPLLPPAPPTPTVAVSPNPSPLPLPAAAAGADGTPPSTLVVEPAVDPATAPPASAPTELATARGADAESARPLPPPEGSTETPAPPASAPESNPAPTEVEGPPAPTPEDATTNPAPPEREPDAVAPRVAPTPLDPTRTDPAAPPVDDPNAKPDPSTVDPLKRLDPAQPGTEPAAVPRDSEPESDPTRRPPVDTPREADPNRTESASTAGSDMRAPSEQRPADSAGTSGGGIDGPQPVDGASSTPSRPSPAGVPGDSLARTGDLSDRESDPTSIIDVPMQNWQNGRPLAAKGIVLKPVRPRFTTLNYVDGVGRNPVGELVFGRDGVPIQTRLLRSTGNPGVDEAIRSALFKWRASGRQLEQLKPGQTLTIRMRLIMLAD